MLEIGAPKNTKNHSARNFYDIQFETFLFDFNCWQQKAEERKRIDLSYHNIMMISEKEFSSNHKHRTHDFTILKSFISQFLFSTLFPFMLFSTLFFKFYFSFINKMKKWRQRKKFIIKQTSFKIVPSPFNLTYVKFVSLK